MRPYPRQGARLCIAWWLCALCAGAGLISTQAEEAGQHHEHGLRVAPKPTASAVVTNAPASQAKFELPPLPKGVSELKFSDFFVSPVGKRGLEVTDKLRQLDGQRVRMLGYMVHQEEPPPGRLLLAPMPAQIHEHDNGLADDLPASMVYVSVPTLPNDSVPFAPGLMLLTGTLSVGNRAEADGRVSIARLALDPPDPATKSPLKGTRFSTPSGKGAERLMSSTSRTGNAAQ